MRLLLAVLTTLLAAQAFAATAYDVRKQHDGRTDEWTVVAEGERMRGDLAVRDDDAILYTSVLGSGGATVIALNARNETWYVLKAQVLGLESGYLNPLYKGQPKNVRWSMSEVNGTYTARLTYDVHENVGGVRMKVRCTADYVIETTDRHPRALWLGRILGDTRLPEVDAQLAAADATIARFPTRLTLTATRTYEGGPTMSDVMVIEASNVHETPADAKAFVRPAGYRNQEPVIAAPGS